MPNKKETEEVMMNFLEYRLIIRFGTLAKTITDNYKAFSLDSLTKFFFKYGIVLTHYPNYYPCYCFF